MYSWNIAQVLIYEIAKFLLWLLLRSHFNNNKYLSSGHHMAGTNLRTWYDIQQISLLSYSYRDVIWVNVWRKWRKIPSGYWGKRVLGREKRLQSSKRERCCYIWRDRVAESQISSNRQLLKEEFLNSFFEHYFYSEWVEYLTWVVNQIYCSNCIENKL